MKTWILLDSKSTDSNFGNSKYVENIQDIPEEQAPFELLTNGGSMTSTKMADCPNFGRVRYEDKHYSSTALRND